MAATVTLVNKKTGERVRCYTVDARDMMQADSDWQPATLTPRTAPADPEPAKPDKFDFPDDLPE